MYLQKNQDTMIENKATYKPLDLNKLKDKQHVIISTEDALKDVIPIQWDEDVIRGNKHVVLVGEN